MSDLVLVTIFCTAYFFLGNEQALLITTVFSFLFFLYSLSQKDKNKIMNYGFMTFCCGLSYALNNPIFFQIKSSIIYSIAAAFLLGYWLVRGKTLLHDFKFQKNPNTKQLVSLNYQIILFLFSVAIMNALVATYCSFSTWVYFKIAIMFGIFLLAYRILNVVGLPIREERP